MGAKTALLAFSDGDIRPALAGATRSDQDEAEDLVRQVHPGHVVTPTEEGTLRYCTHPPDGITYATALAGADLYCDTRLVLERPSQLPEHLHRLGAGQRIIMHGMHSVVDWLAFAVWDDGQLVRSLSLSPTNGIQENIGQPLEFELPYWAGEHPVEPDPDWPSDGPYPLPFHPLELGEEALRALFGFVLEGYPDPTDIDATDVHMHGFRVTDPPRRQQAARKAAGAHVRRATTTVARTPRAMRWGPDGKLRDPDIETP